MSSIVVDTNMFLDFFDGREEFYATAEAILRNKKHDVALTANTITDIYYLLSKERSDTEVRSIVKKIIDAYRVLDVNGDDCDYALKSEIKDFEDAVMDECTYRHSIEYIITRDKKFADSRTKSNVVLAKNFVDK
ncbi:DNA-binding protein [Alphaproteobacteria bacterium]|nr:DNA-binding protein [Alphaproteobacteria bacterium]